jgi:phosphoglycolate phosphatase
MFLDQDSSAFYTLPCHMHRTFRAVLFDLDGTLLDTLEDLADSTNRSLALLGLSVHPVEAYRYFVGDGIENLARRALPADRQDPGTVAELKESVAREYAAHWADKTRIYQGIPELLDALCARKVPMAILSNKPHPFTLAISERYFRRWPFAAVFGARDSHPRKPDPAAALEIGMELGLRPEEMLYAGDSNTDMRTASRAGMFAVGVLWGFRTREELLESGAQALVARPEDLLTYF